MRLFLLSVLLLLPLQAAWSEEPRVSIPAPLDFSLHAEELDQRRPIAVGDLIALRDIGDPYQEFGLTLSPDRTRVAFQIRRADVENNSYDIGWYVAAIVPGSAPIYVGDGGEAILAGMLTSGRSSGVVEVGEAKWSPDGRWIAYRKRIGDEIQIWGARTDGSGDKQWTYNDADVVKFNWSQDGRKIYFDVMPKNRTWYQGQLQREGKVGYLYDARFNVKTGRKPNLRQSISDRSVSKDVRLVPFIYDLKRRTETPDRDGATLHDKTSSKELEQVIPKRNERAIVSIVQIGDRFAWLENTDPATYGGPLPPYTVGRRTTDGRDELCKASECTGPITRVWLDDGNDTVYFRRQDGFHRSQIGLYAWAPDGSVRIVWKNEDRIEDCELAPMALICFYEGWTLPRRLVRIDLDSGAIETLIDPNPEFYNIELGAVEQLEWMGKDGSEAFGHLAYPLDYMEGERYPLIVVQYRSRGFLRGGVGDEYPIHVFAANGFAVLSFDRPELRDVMEKEADMWKRERADWGENLWERESTLTAIEEMIDQLDERGIIDPTRVGITGLSDGSETVWYSMMYSDHFAVAVTSGGAWTPSAYYFAPAYVREGYYAEAAGLQAPGTGGDDRWRRISPEFHASNINTPILIQAADRELLSAVPVHEALKGARKPIEMRVFPDEYHIKFHPKHRAAVYQRNVDWMNFWLRDVEDAAPENVEQYSRWRRMRDEHCSSIRLEVKGQQPAYCR